MSTGFFRILLAVLLAVPLLPGRATAQAEAPPAPEEAPPAPGEAPPAPAAQKIGVDFAAAGAVVVLGPPRSMDLGVRICSVTEAPGVSVGPSGSVLQIDPAVFQPRWLEVAFAKAGGECDKDRGGFRLLPSGRKSWTAPDEVLTLWFDSGVAELKTPGAAPFQMAAVVGGNVAGAAACAGQKSCSLELGAAFLAELAGGSGRAEIIAWPADIPVKAGERLPAVVGPKGVVRDPGTFALQEREVVFGYPLIEEQRLDATEDRRLLTSRFAGAIDQVACDNAECRVTGKGILIFQIDPAASAVKLGYTLKPHYYRKVGSRLVGAENLSLRLERCSVRAPREVPLLAGADNHRYFVKLPRECTSVDAAQLHVETRPPTRAYVRAEIDAGDPGVRLLEVVFDRVPAGTDRVSLSLFERAGGLSRLGSARIPVASGHAPAQIRFAVDGVGLIDHVPSNVPAALRFGTGDPKWLERFTVEARPGFYGVAHSDSGWSILGEAGVTGNVPLRFAYRPKEILPFIGSTEDVAPPLAVFDTESVYAVRSVNIPLSLLSGAAPQKGFFEVICGVPGHEKRIGIGQLARIPYEEREGCRIVFHRQRIPQSAGLQRLRVKAGDFNQIITLSHGSGSLTVAVPVGERKEYARLTVAISHDMLGGHYAEQSRQSLGEEARYRILLSDSWWRISATTAMPTGMFRFGEGAVEGTIPLSAGALGRMTYIQKDGRDFPLGLETGLFGTNLSGQPDFSMVAGLGLSIPVLNPDTSLQASFNIHAWLEYAPTRLSREDSPWAFLFGPSFTVGRLSTTF